jgi:hypothetical protein
MDIFHLTKSKTRQRILNLFLSDANQYYYLRQMEKELSVSAGNIRRELINLVKSDLFATFRQGRMIYYKINQDSPLFGIIKIFFMKNIEKAGKDIISDGITWITKSTPVNIAGSYYCQTRDVFTSRLQALSGHLEINFGDDAYLLSAVTGEIGNNSFDHNLGNWKDIPGVYFSCDEEQKIIVLADRGQGILTTIRNAMPKVSGDKQAVKIAFTKTITGRVGEKRGNGLKFVSQVIKDKKWRLQFYSGIAKLEIDNTGKMLINTQKRNIFGCLAVIKY